LPAALGRACTRESFWLPIVPIQFHNRPQLILEAGTLHQRAVDGGRDGREFPKGGVALGGGDRAEGSAGQQRMLGITDEGQTARLRQEPIEVVTEGSGLAVDR
jgi:hypothetical protein